MKKPRLWILFTALFLLRLCFGLAQSHWADYDERQSYLTGLKFYTTGSWPFFGPDAAGSESQYYSQIPGALEGLAIGLPLYLLPIPEAPFLLVNFLSTAAILLLARYIQRRLPRLSFEWLCLWIGVLPWSLHYPVHISNMSYLFFSGTLFFIGFLESLPSLSMKWISPGWANAWMGFSLFWIMQFHLSYAFLIPLAVYSLGWQTFKNNRSPIFTAKTRRPPRTVKDHPVKKMFRKTFHFLPWRTSRLRGKPVFFFFLGALPPLSLALPTYFQYGFGRINSHAGFFTLLHWDNILSPHVLLARFLSLVCFEVPSFIGAHTSDRIHFLTSHPWILVPGALLWIGGILQAAVLFLAWFPKRPEGRGWKEIKGLTALSFVLLYGSFWFTIKPPLSHIYFVFFPLLMIYSCYVWNFFAKDGRWTLFAKVFTVLGLCFQLGYAMAADPKDSVWSQRDAIAKAIAEKNYHLVGERSPGSLY